MDGDLDVELKDRAGVTSPPDRKQFALSTFSRVLTQTQLLTPREEEAEAEPIIAFKDVTIAVEDGLRTRRIVRDVRAPPALNRFNANNTSSRLLDTWPRAPLRR